MDIIRRHQEHYPVEVMPIASALGLTVFKSVDWPKDVSGMIVKDTGHGGESGYSIYVNGTHPDTRRRFTIAHEIGHFILHKDDIGDGIVDDGLYRSKLAGKKETQANQFAAELLMPWHLINKAMGDGNKTVQALANVLNVSISAMSIRLGVPDEGNSPQTNKSESGKVAC